MQEGEFYKTIIRLKEKAMGCRADELLGLSITEACCKLGYWWVVKNLHTSQKECTYFLRGAVAGIWHLQIETNSNNIITQIH